MIVLSGVALKEVDRGCVLYTSMLEIHSRIALQDPTIWGKPAEAEATIRLNWVNLDETSRDLLPILDALTAKFKGDKDLVLCGMGGSSLAPEVIAQTFKKPIFIIDSTDPNYFSHALQGDPQKLLIIISSKSGSTIETASASAFFIEYLKDAGLDPTNHMVFVTDPNSAMDLSARESGFSVINADPNVGGRFSALTAFGLTPAALMGIDTSVLLDQASDCKAQLTLHPEIVLDVTYLLFTQAQQFLAFTDAGSAYPGLSEWIEQLIAESTGKEGRGRLPIAIQSLAEANLGGAFPISFAPGGALVVQAELGEHFLFWEWVTALLSALLKVDPFNQPNVTEAKEATTTILREWNNALPTLHPESQDGEVAIYGAGNSIVASLKNLIAISDAEGYIAIMAYLDRRQDSQIVQLQELLAEKSGRPVSFGWGPRFLHSTGQFHKGGQQNGSFLQITGVTDQKITIPGSDFDFSTLLMAQALGDAKALSARKYPLLRLHLNNRSAGITQILNAAQSL